MRSIPLSLLIALALSCSLAQAEEETVQPAAPTASVDTEKQVLEQRLTESEQLRSEQQSSSAAQLQRLRQENQRLRLQLKESQAQVQPGLLTETQTWFALGATLSLISMLIGALLRGRRKTRREWIN
ncbi:translation initiation factor 2 (IF-2, GTPase) [Pseudomonas sp. SH1-B]